MVRSRPRRHPSGVCRIQLHCTDTLQLQVLGEWYDHRHNGTPRVCRIQLHCTDTLQLQVFWSGTITARRPLVFVEYNYIVPTPYSCRFLGVVRSRPRWPPRVCRIQLHCTDTLLLQALGNGTITATTAPLVFVENNYMVPTPYSCRFLGVVRSRPRRLPLVFVEYNYIVPTPYSCRFLGMVRSRPRRPPSCL